ncbi:hypothetical protein RhiirA1_427532 [Rhizophagus irregularis]|uniref:Uncharacterized protein n=2 Tax=Rhizophagus irregularis TaxID=588596 RepID=A0A2N0R5V5_9GLOM|nr:hypothetical protein RhiirA1_427532 [Rhizophagus irregularis]GBC11100.1 hypothetical protein RIR_e4338_A0A2N0R5V5_9GLOM [Rhizophagus irregularis DAOM 181602=DAOM 197198]
MLKFLVTAGQSAVRTSLCIFRYLGEAILHVGRSIGGEVLSCLVSNNYSRRPVNRR